MSTREVEFAPYVCNCDCHEPGAAVIHFMPCCEGVCPTCGEAYQGLEEHHRQAHGGPLPAPDVRRPHVVSRRRRKHRRE